MFKKSFTLIEMVVVVAIVGLVVPAIFAIIFGILREQTKINKLVTVKAEGDYILNIVANSIRSNAFSIHSANPPSDANLVCDVSASSNPGPLYFQDPDGGWFGYSVTGDTVASESSALTEPAGLNSEQTIISNFTLNCSRVNSYAAPVISLAFDICFKTGTGICTSSRVEETAQLHYQTKIKLRNF
jgi:competence protein ComGC